VARKYCPVLIFLDVPLSHNQFASFFGSYNLPTETSVSSSLRPASYAMERKTGYELYIDVGLIWGSQELIGWVSLLMVSEQRSHS
jgi:hypothetical protein